MQGGAGRDPRGSLLVDPIAPRIREAPPQPSKAETARVSLRGKALKKPGLQPHFLLSLHGKIALGPSAPPRQKRKKRCPRIRAYPITPHSRSSPSSPPLGSPVSQQTQQSLLLWTARRAQAATLAAFPGARPAFLAARTLNARWPSKDRRGRSRVSRGRSWLSPKANKRGTMRRSLRGNQPVS